MHEKVQLERLLDGLQGHDWLRIMGISGITDTEKKAFEPKRDYFIAEVGALVDKFKKWKDEEKRLRLEKGQAMLAADDDEEDHGDNEDGDEEQTSEEGDSVNSSYVDAQAARQLHDEASPVSHFRKKRSLVLKPPAPPAPEKPFTSFYSKPYLREAALAKHRRGRSRTAFGHPCRTGKSKNSRCRTITLPRVFLLRTRGRRGG